MREKLVMRIDSLKCFGKITDYCFRFSIVSKNMLIGLFFQTKKAKKIPSSKKIHFFCTNQSEYYRNKRCVRCN